MSEDCAQSDELHQVSHRLTSMTFSGNATPDSTLLCRKTIWWRSMATVFAWVTTCLLAAHASAYGQSTTYARLVGTIKDQSGAVLDGADITATALATNVPQDGQQQ